VNIKVANRTKTVHIKSLSAFIQSPMMIVVVAEEKKQVLNNPVMDRANRLCKMEASNGRRTFGTENERNR
jgi:hypothetical protein